MCQAVTACSSPPVSSAWRAAQRRASSDDGEPSIPTTILLWVFRLVMLALLDPAGRSTGPPCPERGAAGQGTSARSVRSVFLRRDRAARDRTADRCDPARTARLDSRRHEPSRPGDRDVRPRAAGAGRSQTWCQEPTAGGLPGDEREVVLLLLEVVQLQQAAEREEGGEEVLLALDVQVAALVEGGEVGLEAPSEPADLGVRAAHGRDRLVRA